MPDIQFAHPDGELDTATIDDENWEKGPPEVFPDGGRAYEDMSTNERRATWERWLHDGHELSILDEAWKLVDRARSRLDGPSAAAANPHGQYQSSFAALDGDVGRITVNKIVGDAVVAAPVTYRLAPRQFWMGPPDAQGRHDAAFAGLDPATAQQRWQTYLVASEPPPTPAMASARRWYERRLLWAEHPVQAPRFEKALAALGVEYEDRPAAMWSTVLAGLFMGLGGGGIFGLLWAFGEVGGLPLPPPDLTTTVTTDPAGTSTLTVAWSRAAYGSAATGYAVAVTSLDGANPPLLPWHSMGTETSVVFPGIAVGSWQVSAVAFDGDASSAAATATVAVPQPGVVAAFVPTPPSGVTLRAADGLRSVVVDWSPKATARREPTSYRVRLDGPPQPGVGVDVPVELQTHWSLGGLAPGTYTASVTASNMFGDSAPAPSTPLTLGRFSTPGLVSGLTARVSRSATSPGKCSLLLTWSPPTTGDAVAGYVVQLTPPVGIPENAEIVSAPSITLGPLTDGRWTVGVTAYNVDTTGSESTVAVAVDHASVDPDGVDWTAAFGPAQVTAWENLRVELASMDEQSQFWPHVLDVLADPKGAHGGPADLPAQLFVAKLLATWLSLPANPTDPRRIPDDATRLAAACSPPFPTKPPQPGEAGYTGDPFALWKAARTLRNATGTTAVVLRYKLLAVAVALERYLDGNP